MLDYLWFGRLLTVAAGNYFDTLLSLGVAVVCPHLLDLQLLLGLIRIKARHNIQVIVFTAARTEVLIHIWRVEADRILSCIIIGAIRLLVNGCYNALIITPFLLL